MCYNCILCAHFLSVSQINMYVYLSFLEHALHCTLNHSHAYSLNGCVVCKKYNFKMNLVM